MARELSPIRTFGEINLPFVVKCFIRASEEARNTKIKEISTYL